MIERVLVVSAVLLATVGVALVVRALARKRIEGVLGHQVPSALARRLKGASASIVYFYGRHCGTCEQQKAVLDELARETRTRIVAVDAEQDRFMADLFRLTTIPATALVDRQGRIHRVNVGYQPKQVLTEQLASLEAAG